MLAVTYRDYGAAEVLKLEDRPLPAADSRKVLIRVAAASVNPIDWRMRSGELRYLLPGGFPRIPGFDVAGTVEKAPQDSGLQTGERVLAFLTDMYGGASAQFAACLPRGVAKIPDSLSDEDAAALPLAGSTALQSLLRHGRLQTGQRVVVNGASGGVGSYAVQIAKATGAYVIAVASGKNRQLVESLGADQFVDYKREDVTQMELDCDLFFDAAGKASYFAARRSLRRGGRFVSTEPSARGALLTALTTVLPGPQCRVMLAMSRKSDLEQLVQLCVDGHIRVVRNETFSLSDAAAAHRRGEAGEGTGKIVLRVDG